MDLRMVKLGVNVNIQRSDGMTPLVLVLASKLSVFLSSSAFILCDFVLQAVFIWQPLQA